MSYLHLPATITNKGKRSRSNSSSSSASSSGASILSRFTSTDASSDSLSTYSSPTGTSEASPYSGGQDEERPCKTLKTDAVNAALNGLEEKCSLNVPCDRKILLNEPERPILASCGKNFFVDCLVDSAVHLLDIIWDAPLERSIAFVCNETPATADLVCEDIVRKVNCPTGTNISQQSIPLELFVRETLRRSRTSCSTLQAALLFCKRVGVDVVRRRAEAQGTTLTSVQLKKLSRLSPSYPSLAEGSSSFDPQDYLGCNRRIFLASIMISSKYLQDRTFSNRAWSKISGLNVQELSRIERRLLKALDFNLNVQETTWTNWTNFLQSQWKTRQPIARNGLLHSNSVTAAQVMISRNALSRTNSLPETNGFAVGGDVVEADMTLPSGDQQRYSFTWPGSSIVSSPSSLCNPADRELDASTPTLQPLAKSGDSTPTPINSKDVILDVVRKPGQSLLSAAIHNHHIQSCS